MAIIPQLLEYNCPKASMLALGPCHRRVAEEDETAH